MATKAIRAILTTSIKGRSSTVGRVSLKLGSRPSSHGQAASEEVAFSRGDKHSSWHGQTHASL
eukprot:5999000-Amphidinium_carterae.1